MNRPADSPTSLEGLVGDVADRYMQRVSRGETPDVEEYARLHPQIADLLRKLLPTLNAIPGHIQSLAAPDLTTDGTFPDRDQAVQGTLGDYRILRQVGRGGMGVVYEAEQLSLQRRVALKILPFAAVLDERQIKRFRNEAHAAASLDHPNIVEIYGVGCDRGVHYYAMRFVEGRPISELLTELVRERAGQEGTALAAASPGHSVPTGDAPASQRPSPLPELGAKPETTPGSTPARAALTTQEEWERGEYWRRVARFGRQVAEALEHAHEHGIVHRDVKPGNLLLDVRGKIWITDFGLAQIETSASLTLTGDLVGTARYMSPEQALAKRVPLDHRTDVYSLGVTLYELLTLRPAFTGTDRQEILRQIAFDDPKPPRRINPAIPAELETVVMKAMAKNPAERYATAKDFADDLGRFLEDQPIRARRPTILQRAGKWVRRHKTVVWTFSVTALAMVALAVISLVVSNYLIHSAYEVTLGDLTRTSQALDQEKTKLQLLTHLEKARALRQSLEPGRRFAGEAELKKAAQLYALLPPDEPTLLALRREWIATSALSPDLRRVREIQTQGLRFVVSKDFQRYMVVEPGQRLRIRRLSDDQEVCLLLPPKIMPPDAHGFSIEGSPDGRFIAVGYGNGRDDVYQTWDIFQQKELLPPYRVSAFESGPAFSVDSKVMYYYLPDETTAPNHSIRRFDLVDRKHLSPLKVGTAVPVRGIRFARNAPRAAISFLRDGKLGVFDLTTDAMIGSFPLGGDGWSALSPDGRRVAVVPRRNSIHIYNVDSGQLEQLLVGHTNVVTEGEFHAQYSLLFTAGWDGNPRYWDRLTGREMGRFRDNRGGIAGLNAEGSLVVYQTATGGEILEVVPSAVYRQLETDLIDEQASPSGSIAFSPDGRFLAFASSYGTHIGDPASGRTVALIEDGHCASVFFDSTGCLVTSSQLNGLRRWPIRREQATNVFTIGPPKVLTPLPRGGVRSACLTPDGQTGAAVDGDQVVVFESGRPDVERLDGSHPSAEHIAISSDGRWIATADRFRGVSVKLWDRQAGKLINPDLWSNIGWETQVGFTHDGKWMQAINLSGATSRVWEVGSWRLVDGGQLTPGIYGHHGSLRALRIENELIQLADTHNGQTLASLDPPAPVVMCGGWFSGVAFTQDGDRLAVITERYIHLWDLRQIRKGLAELGLDWSLPPYPPATPSAGTGPLRVHIDYGELKNQPK